MDSNQGVGALAIMFAAALWAVDGVVLRPKLYHLDVSVVVFLEHIIALVLMTLFCWKYFPEFKKLKLADWLAFTGVGLFGGAIGGLAITKAIFYVHSAGANISIILLIQKLQPVFAIILAVVLLNEKPTKNFLYWAGFALIGSYILTFGFGIPELSLENATLVAALFSLLAAFSWGSSTVFSKRAITKLSFQAGTYMRFLVTSIIMFVIITLFWKFPQFQAVESKDYLTMAIIAVTTGGLAIFIYYFGLKRIRASAATLYELAFPITSIILEWFLQGKFMGFQRLFGAVILSFAIVMLVRDKQKFADITMYGKVNVGQGKGASFVKLYADKLRERTGFVPYPGTLNVTLDEPIRRPHSLPLILQFKKDGKTFGKVRLMKVTLNRLPCFILFPEKTTNPKNVIEIVSPYELRKELKLEDGDSVELVIDNS
jgi:drug/metabolite transporter (DMT)-like permease